MGYGNREQLKIAGTSGNYYNRHELTVLWYFSGNGIGTTDYEREGNVLIDAYNQGGNVGIFQERLLLQVFYT